MGKEIAIELQCYGVILATDEDVEKALAKAERAYRKLVVSDNVELV